MVCAKICDAYYVNMYVCVHSNSLGQKMKVDESKASILTKEFHTNTPL